jgi:predicted DNA-binding transcriptional regulator AlpA
MTRFSGVKELADCLGVSPSWIYVRTRKGATDLIPHIKLGKYLRFDIESPSFQEWLKAHEIKSRR